MVAKVIQSRYFDLHSCQGALTLFPVPIRPSWTAVFAHYEIDHSVIVLIHFIRLVANSFLFSCDSSSLLHLFATYIDITSGVP